MIAPSIDPGDNAMRTAILAASVLATLAFPAFAHEGNGAQPPVAAEQATDVHLFQALHLTAISTTRNVPSEHRCDWVAWMTGVCTR